jgi:hypothetical protein
LHSFHGWIHLRSESWQWVQLLSDGHSMHRVLCSSLHCGSQISTWHAFLREET